MTLESRLGTNIYLLMRGNCKMMIKWTANFSVNHEEIDEQHKELIHIIEECVVLTRTEDNDLYKNAELLSKLDDYVKKHLEYEEKLMKRYLYPEIDSHVAQHNELRSKLEETNMFDINNSRRFYQEMLLYLVDWLSNHIMQTDKKLGLFLAKA